MPISNSNNPSLVAKALAKAQSVESRLNALVAQNSPTLPSVVYNSTQTIVTQSSNGNYTWTCPTGVTSAMIECWGAGAGGGGGGASEGGGGGGGGAYSQEALYVTVPGTVYDYTVGNGGAGGPSGVGGTDGGDSFFDNAGVGVYAHGGDAGSSFNGGAGGDGTSNSISTVGGTGGGDGSQSTGGCGGGGSAGSTGNGGDASDSGSSTGSAGGSAGTGGGAAGGAGGNSAANGSNGSSPGGGGGGCGAASSASITKTYNASGCRSYYGSDGSNPNATRATNSTCWHGGTFDGGGGYNGTQKSIITFPTNPNITSDFSGATAVSATLALHNNHAFYTSGMDLRLKTWLVSGGAPGTWNGSSSVGTIYDSFINQGVTKNFSLGQTVAAGFIAGTNFGIALGPGPTMNNNWYGYFAGAGQTNNPKLTIVATTGATVTAGSGADGRVRITYTTPDTLVAALQPTAVTDPGGNDLAAGITVTPVAGTTGTGVVAVQPGSSPANLETWHTVTGGVGFQNSWTDTTLKAQYKMTGDNCVHIIGTMVPGTKTDGTTMFQLPAGYRPNKQVCCPIGVQGSGGNTFSANVPAAFISVETTGNVNIFGVNLGGTTSFIHFNALVPLDTIS
jgi:hypothetical protein